MKYIKLAFISIIVFAVVVTLVSLLFPSNVRISKAIDVRSSPDTLHAYLADPAKWQGWFPGADTLEPVSLMQKVIGYRVNDQGAMIRITGRNDSAIQVTTSGRGVKDGIQGWNILPGAVPGQTTVQWYMDFHLRWYPWEKFSSIMFEKRYGPMLEQGLERLKEYVER
jgi:hypothetical protein